VWVRFPSPAPLLRQCQATQGYKIGVKTLIRWQPDLPAESGEARIDGLARLSLHPTVLRNPSTPQILLSFMLRQKQESQHAQHGEAERGFLAVPGMRLPHEEVLSTDNLKPR
jgi:hypothetical protein